MKLKLAALIGLLLAVIAGAVLLGSPYAPVVGAYREIEELWDIEDARVESEQPLVTSLTCNGIPMVYDADANRFYCVLGLGQGSEWPEMHITAPGEQASDLQICFADDYTYDWCNESIASGYPYLLMAYTQTEFSYFEVVFTGLPMLSLTTDVDRNEIGAEDVPVLIDMAAADGGISAAPGRIHRRGGATFNYDKPSFRLEFTRGANGKRKISREVPGFGTVNSLILLACWADTSMMHDRFSWEMYSRIADDSEPFSACSTAYVELVINGEYLGVYVALVPQNMEVELAKVGGTPTDSVYRTAFSGLARERDSVPDPLVAFSCFELYYTPVTAGHEFDALEDYFDLTAEEDDEVFAQKAASRLRMDSLLRYLLLVQAMGLTDSVDNNMTVWAHPTGGTVLYGFAPWDMDDSWGSWPDIIGEDYENWMYFPLADRVLNLDVGGARARLAELWAQYKELGFNIETVAEVTQGYADELNNSGAMLRNTERWGLSSEMLDPFPVYTFASMRFARLDEVIAFIAEAEGEIGFLAASTTKEMAGPIFFE